MSRGGRLLQSWRAQTAANSEGDEWKGLSKAWDTQGRFALAQGKVFDRSRGWWLANCVRCVGKCDGLPVLIDRACQVAEVGHQVEGTASKCGRVAEDAKVLRRGQGVSVAGVGGDG